MCPIWSCGTVKSEAVFAFASDAEYEVIFDSAAPGPAPQPANAYAAARHGAKRIGLVNFFMANSLFPQPGASAPARSCTLPTPGDTPIGWPCKCALHRDNRASSRRRVDRRTG